MPTWIHIDVRFKGYVIFACMYLFQQMQILEAYRMGSLEFVRSALFEELPVDNPVRCSL